MIKIRCFLLSVIFLILHTLSFNVWGESWTRHNNQYYFLPRYTHLKSNDLATFKVLFKGKNPYVTTGIFLPKGVLNINEQQVVASTFVKNIQKKIHMNVQFDAQNFYPDGSVRFAIVTVEKPKNTPKSFEVILSKSFSFGKIKKNIKPFTPNLSFIVTLNNHKKVQVNLLGLKLKNKPVRQGALLHEVGYEVKIAQNRVLDLNVIIFANKMMAINFVVRDIKGNILAYPAKGYLNNKQIKLYKQGYYYQFKAGYMHDNIAALNMKKLMDINVLPYYDLRQGIVKNIIDNKRKSVSSSFAASLGVHYMMTLHEKARSQLFNHIHILAKFDTYHRQKSLFYLAYLITGKRIYYDNLIISYQQSLLKNDLKSIIKRQQLMAEILMVSPAKSKMNRTIKSQMNSDFQSIKEINIQDTQYDLLGLSFAAISGMHNDLRGMNFISDPKLLMDKVKDKKLLTLLYYRAVQAMIYNITKNPLALEQYGQLTQVIIQSKQYRRYKNYLLSFQIIPKFKNKALSQRNFIVTHIGQDTIQAPRNNVIIMGSQQTNIVSFGDYTGVGFGGKGNDILNAGKQGDYLFGGDGSDILVSGTGDDYFKGDSGNQINSDIFIFNNARFGSDTIADFQVSVDKIKFTPNTGILNFYHDNKIYGIKKDKKNNISAYRKVINPDVPSHLSPEKRREKIYDLMAAASRNDIDAKMALKEFAQTNHGVKNYLRDDGKGGTYIDFNKGRTPSEAKKIQSNGLYDYYGVIHLPNVPLEAIRASDFIFSN